MPGMFPGPIPVNGGPVQNFPVVAATNSSGGTSTTTTTFTAALPASISSGDLLLLFVYVNRTANDANPSLTTPDTWNVLFSTLSSFKRFACYWKSASGSEGSTIGLTSSTATAWATNSYRITGWTGTPEAGTSATGSNAAPNPPSLAPSWGSAKTLWLAASASDANSATVPTPPTNYTDQVTNSHVFFEQTFARITTARRELLGTSDDPGTFSYGASGQWIAQTIAIEPA